MKIFGPAVPHITSTRTMLLRRLSGWPSPAALIVAALLVAMPALGSAEDIQPPPGCRGTESLRFLSINLRHGEAPDGSDNVSAVVELINRIRPDVVAIQEVDRGVQRSDSRDLPAELAAATAMYPAFEATLDQYQGGQYGLLLLSRAQPDDVRVHPLPHQAGREPRIVQEAFFSLESGTTLLVFSTHLGYDDPDDLQRAQFDLLRQRAGDHESDITVLIGDLNVGMLSEEHDSLLGSFADAAPPDSPGTYPATAPTVQLDHILYRTDVDAEVTRFEIVQEPIVSDHLPVWAEIELCVGTSSPE